MVVIQAVERGTPVPLMVMFETFDDAVQERRVGMVLLSQWGRPACMLRDRLV